MSWIAFVWSVNVGACLALAAIYMGVWCKQRETWMYLLFSCFAAAAGAIAVFELQLIHANAPEKYGAILRWRSVPAWMLVVSLVGFTRLYFRSGRSWLGWSVCGTWTLALILNERNHEKKTGDKAVPKHQLNTAPISKNAQMQPPSQQPTCESSKVLSVVRDDEMPDGIFWNRNRRFRFQKLDVNDLNTHGRVRRRELLVAWQGP